MQVMLLPGLDMSIDHLLPQAMNPLPAIPWDMLIPNGVSLQVVGMVKVGKTLGGSQMLNIANLPAVHYPFVLGIPRQMQCAPFTIAHQDLILDSLHALLKLLATQDTSIGSFVPFSQQLSQEASQDAGHLVSTVAAICMCLLSGRSSLALAGIFGAGKTTSVTFVLMWLALTTPPNVKFTVVSKENPAGQAIAAQVDRMKVPDQAKLSLLPGLWTDSSESLTDTISGCSAGSVGSWTLATSLTSRRRCSRPSGELCNLRQLFSVLKYLGSFNLGSSPKAS